MLQRIGLSLPPGLGTPNESLSKAKAALLYEEAGRSIAQKIKDKEMKENKEKTWKTKVVELVQKRDPEAALDKRIDKNVAKFLSKTKEMEKFKFVETIKLDGVGVSLVD